MDVGRRLEDAFETIGEEYHVIGCRESGSSHTIISAGFLAFRSTRKALDFLDAWTTLHPVFKGNWNPDNDALNHLLTIEKYKKLFFAMSPKELSAFSDSIGNAPAYQRTLTAHFAAKERKLYIKDWFDKVVSPMPDTERLVLYSKNSKYQRPKLD
jgi:hypothetical protein